MNPELSYSEILTYIDTFDVVQYAKTRNHLQGTVSKLSPYITRGVIDLPTIRDRVLKRYSYQQAEKFIQELAWREYFQKVWQAKGDDIFSDLRFPRTDWIHHEVVSALPHARTGITVIDTQLTELFETGYMHNHSRLWTAMIACNIAKAHWFTMSTFLYYHLLDGDLASNTLSWQWVAGTNTSKRYTTNQTLIDACSGNTQSDSYLNLPIEDIETMDIPAELRPHEPLTYTCSYPDSDIITDLSNQTVFLYHPWSLNPLWRTDSPSVRILVIEPRLFDRFPVSPKVMAFIVNVARKHIPYLKIFVGNIETLPSINQATTIYSKRSGATTHWPGTIDAPTELFPTVTGYFPSFFKFWQACLKTL